jgi:hypothetical protein
VLSSHVGNTKCTARGSIGVILHQIAQNIRHGAVNVVILHQITRAAECGCAHDVILQLIIQGTTRCRIIDAQDYTKQAHTTRHVCPRVRKHRRQRDETLSDRGMQDSRLHGSKTLNKHGMQGCPTIADME